MAEYNPKLQDVSAATRVAYAKFKTKMLMSQINETEDDSQPGTPAEQPKNLTKSQAKAQSLKLAKRASVVKQQKQAQSEVVGSSRAGKPLPKGISIDPVGPYTIPGMDGQDTKLTKGSAKGSMDLTTPILKSIHQEVQKQRESRESSLKSRGPSGASTPAPQRSTTSGVGSDAASESIKEECESERKMSSTSTTSPPPMKPERMPAPSSERKLSAAKKPTEFTVVQIETARPQMSEEEGGGGDKKGGDGGETGTTKSKDKEGKRKGSSASAASASVKEPTPPPRPPSPTGKSAVTGQTRTGWI